MTSAKKQVAKAFSVYVGTSIINRALPFMLLPILTWYLSPAEYGILAVYQTLIGFALPFIGMKMETNITRNIFKRKQSEVAKIFSNMLVILCSTAIICSLLLAICLAFLDSVCDIPKRWLYLIPVITVMNMLNQFNLTFLRNQQRAVLYGLLEVLNTALNLALTVLMVVGFHYGWEGRALATVLASVVFGIVGIIYVWRSGFIRFEIDPPTIKEILNVSMPLVPYSLGAMIIFMSDRIFLDRMVGKTAVGLYATAYSFGMIVTLVTEAFNRAWSPWMYARLANMTDERKIEIVRFTYAYKAFLIGLAFAVTIASHLLIKVMTNERYHSAGQFIVWVALANAVNGMYAVLMPYSVNEGKTRPLAAIMTVAAVVNLIGNYVLIKMNGAVGAAQATLLAYVISYSLNWWHASNIYPMPWLKKEVFVSQFWRNRLVSLIRRVLPEA